MNQNLKQHINNINKGIVPKGWVFSEFCEFVERSKEKFNPKIEKVELPCIELEHINQKTGTINGYVNSNQQKSIKNKFCEGQVLFGKLRPYLKKFWFAKFEGVCSSEIWVLNGKRDKMLNGFLFFFIQHHRFIQTTNISSGTKMPRADWPFICKYPFLLPPLPEQQKIATILSTWDKAIELKEQLIEQKKQQKKGLMQNLLTGKIRVKGFKEEWKEMKLGDIGTFKTSSVDKKIVVGEEKVGLLNYMDVYKNKIIDERVDFMKITAKQKQIESSIMQYGDVAFTPSSETPDDIGHSSVFKIKDSNVLHSYHVVRLRFKIDMDIDFKGYIFNVEYLLNEFSRRATGSTRFTLSISDFKEVSIKLPLNIKEQKAIANILTSSDKEIELLNQELDSMKEQKKGLMQLLLTGKVRVKV